MLKYPRKLKLVDFAWYFVVLTRGFYLTALTTCSGLVGWGENAYANAHCKWKMEKQGQAGKLHVPQSGQKHCSTQENKNKKNNRKCGERNTTRTTTAARRRNRNCCILCQTVPDCQTVPYRLTHK